MVISGQSGTGKTKLVQHLFRLSSIYQNTFSPSSHQQTSPLRADAASSSSSTSFDVNLNSPVTMQNAYSASPSSSAMSTAAANIQVKYLASNLAGVHVCVREDKRTREPGQFLHNLVWSLTHFDCLHKIVQSKQQQQQNNNINSEKYVLILTNLLAKFVLRKLKRLSYLTIKYKAKRKILTFYVNFLLI